jgi:hypothetical protein
MTGFDHNPDHYFPKKGPPMRRMLSYAAGITFAVLAGSLYFSSPASAGDDMCPPTDGGYITEGGYTECPPPEEPECPPEGGYSTYGGDPMCPPPEEPECPPEGGYSTYGGDPMCPPNGGEPPALGNPGNGKMVGNAGEKSDKDMAAPGVNGGRGKSTRDTTTYTGPGRGHQ